MKIEGVSSYIPYSFPCWIYDVFVSFRGEDTRKNFIDHLYAALNQEGIYVFRDDKQLEKGKSISPGLSKAIEESRLSIVVFSTNYACSTWCLDELVKIVECKNRSTDQQIVIPIFYDVEPTVVRKQIGKFQEAFAKHEEAFRKNAEKVQKWRDALKEVANISGWEFNDRNESEFMGDIVKEISSKLIVTKSETHREIVGINSRLDELDLLLNRGSDDVRMIGIYGMGGLGKTTIARVVYDLISSEFEGSSFLADVREISEKEGLISLQKQLVSALLKLTDSSIRNVYEGIKLIGSRLRRKKILLVIDDVVNVKQLESLAGKRDWFGSGSRIIITSRDKHLLITHGVDEVYKPEGLNVDEARCLFCMKAFKANEPTKEFEDLSQHVVEYAAGLPLALRVLGSFLFGRTVEEWESAIQRLKRDSENEILEILQISFDSLQETEKKIFLDIACFFKGKDRDRVTTILEGCDFDPGIGIRVLVDKSLISILDNNILWMHDLLQEMGQKVVKRQSKEPGKCSRLWEEADVHHVLSENTGTEVVEAMHLLSRNMRPEAVEGKFWFIKDQMEVGAKAFSKMTNLRLLKISNLQLPEGLECLSNELRFLEWHGYPLKSLPLNSRLHKIVELNMCYSAIEQIWNGFKALNNLKFLRLSYSNLIRTPDVTGVPNLEKLILEGCTKLREIHPSLMVHKKLINLNLKNCTNLTFLPSHINMESLRRLSLSGCSKLKKFPEIVGGMERLYKLPLDGTGIEELPLSVELLSGLAFMNLNNCNNLVRLPSTIYGLKSLKTLNLSCCSKLENLPENLGKLESLEELDISGTAIRKPVKSLFLLKNLKFLCFRGCKGPPAASTSWFSHFPINLMQRRSLHPIALMLPSLSGLSSLTKLDLSDCNLGEGAIPVDICNLFSLEELILSKNSFVSLPGTINNLSELKYLELEDCKRLESLPELPSSVWIVKMAGCAALETMSDAFKQSQIKYFDCINCLKLAGSNNLAFSMLKWFLEERSKSIFGFSIVVPGSKIPQWFRYQSEGSSVTITRPPSSYYNENNLVGYAFCSVFHVHKHPQRVRSSCARGTLQLYCHMKVDKIETCCSCFIDFDEQLGRPVSDHLWLLYLPSGKLRHSGWKFESNHVEFSFRSVSNSCPELEVKRCGMLPVYVDEAEGFTKTRKEWNLNEQDQVFSATTSKRRLKDYADEEPQPKRFKELNK